MTLHSMEIGSTGQRVVFLHGLFGQGRNFTHAARALEPGAHSLLVDLPNHGRSDWTDTVGFPEMADAVAEHLSSGFAAAGPVHVVGHSMGGKVAMLLALRHPDLIDRLVVVDISPNPSDGASEFEHLLGSLAAIDLTSLARRRDAQVALADQVPEEGVREFLLQNLTADRSAPDADPVWRWRANLALLRRELSTITGFPHLGPETVPFDHPVLWIAGEHSSYVGPGDEPEMRRLFPRTRQVTIKGAGHWVHTEQPDAFVSALRVFLRVADPS